MKLKSPSPLSADTLAQLTQLEIKTNRLINTPFIGNYTSVFKGQGMQFSESRPYQPGDDVRRIDWTVTAKRQEPYIKIFEQERELTIMILADISGSLSFGSHFQTKREQAVQTAALLGFAANRHSDAVGLCLCADQVEHYIPPKKGRHHVLNCLAALQTHAPKSPKTNLTAGIDYLLTLHKRPIVLAILSDFQDPGYDAALAIAAKRHDVIPIVISDPAETQLPNAGIVSLQDPETGDTLWLDTSDSDTRHRFKTMMRIQAKQQARQFKSLGLTPITLQTNDSPIQALKTYFTKRLARQ